MEDKEHDWFDRSSKEWLYKHWDKQSKKGNNFANGLIKTKDDNAVQSIKKRYLAIQGDNPVVANEEGTKHRLFTLTEIKRLFELPDSFKLNCSKTTAGEILGQGVIVGLFKKIISALNLQPLKQYELNLW